MSRGYLPPNHVAKPQRQTFVPLPLSAAFYRSLTRVAQRSGLHDAKGSALADSVAELSRAYTRERESLASRSQGQTALGARLAFFLPRDLPKIFGPLDALPDKSALLAQKRLRVLDLGAGLGTTSLGLSRYLKLSGAACERLEVTALERDAQALSVFQQLVTEVASLPEEFVPISLEARAGDLRKQAFGREFDLVVCGFVINELFTEQAPEERIAARAQLLRDMAACLRPQGSLVVLEPALKESTRELMAVRDLLATQAGAPFVHAPCIHDNPCPMLQGERDWCHQELAYALPPDLARVAEGAGLRFEGLSSASLVLRNEPRPVLTQPDRDVYRIVSQRLETKGKLELFGCGERGYVRLSRLDRDASAANAAFGAAQRGQILEVGALDEKQRIASTTQVTRKG